MPAPNLRDPNGAPQPPIIADADVTAPPKQQEVKSNEAGALCGRVGPGPSVHRGRFVLRLATIGLLLLVSVGLVGCFAGAHPRNVLRDSIIPEGDPGWEKRIELGVGWVPLSLARAILGFVEVPPEARAAAGAVRRVDFGVYQWRSGAGEADHAEVLQAGDRAMGRLGWERLVGVLEDRNWVVIYAPAHARPGTTVKLCVAVFSDDHLVIASVKGDLQPLLDLAVNHPEWPKLHAALSL